MTNSAQENSTDKQGGPLSRLARPFAPITRPIGRVFRSLARPFADALGLVPAFFAGAGVFLVVAGLFNYVQPAVPLATPSDTPGAVVSIGPYGTFQVLTPGPSTSGVPQTYAIATRIRIPALSIDLPIVASPAHEVFPLCNTAEYLTVGQAYAYPGAPQATYVYAHARVYMFWQLLAQSRINNGAGMIGMWVEVYTADDQLHIYEITRVIRHVPPNTAFADQALAATTDQLWMQTSEGHLDSSTKLQVVAMPVGVLSATYADSHPKPTGKICPDAPICTASNQGGCRKP